jgi:hypothetical protein
MWSDCPAFVISSERMMKNDELITLKGGNPPKPGQYSCYKYGSAGNNCNTLIADLYAFDCESALYACMISGGTCVEC